MSAAEMRSLENELALLSYFEKLTLIEYLAKSLKNSPSENNDFDGEPNEETLEAAAEICEQVAAGNAGTTDVDAFFAELDD